MVHQALPLVAPQWPTRIEGPWEASVVRAHPRMPPKVGVGSR